MTAARPPRATRRAVSAAAFVAAVPATRRPMNWVYAPNSCILATRFVMTLAAEYGIAARPLPVRAIVLGTPTAAAFRAVGRDLSRLPPGSDIAVHVLGPPPPGVPPPGPGWYGHLVAIVAGRYLVDLSIDQMNSDDYGVRAEPIVISLGQRAAAFIAGKAEIEAETADPDMIIFYTADPDDDGRWRRGVAWTDRDDRDERMCLDDMRRALVAALRTAPP